MRNALFIGAKSIFLRKAIIIIYSSYVYLLAIILLVLLGPFVFVFIFFGELKGGNLIYKACNVYTRLWFFLSGINYKALNTSKHSATSQYVFVANHTSYLDVFCLLRAINQPIRALGKIEMGAYPIFGYFYKKVVVSVDRNNIAMRAQSIATLKKYLVQKVSIFIFPEGTFNETRNPLKSFYDGAFRIAIDTQTPIQPILFLDNNKRMNNSGSFNMTPGKCRIVFLDEVPVDGLTKSNLDQLKQRVFTAMKNGLLANGFVN